MLALKRKSLKKHRTTLGDCSCPYCVAPQRTQRAQRTAENYITTGDTGDTGENVAHTERTSNEVRQCTHSIHERSNVFHHAPPPGGDTNRCNNPARAQNYAAAYPPSTISHPPSPKKNAPIRRPGRSHAPCRNRTYNLVIKSHLLCQLS